MYYNINQEESKKILVVGNSFCASSLSVSLPWPELLSLNNFVTEGSSLDYQANLILNLEKDSFDKIIWVLGHELVADPRGDGSFMMKYAWGVKDIWGKKSKTLWYDFFTTSKWHHRIALLSVISVLNSIDKDKILVMPLFRNSITNNKIIFHHPSIYRSNFGEYRNKYPDGSGHVNQEGHNAFSLVMYQKLRDLEWLI